MTTNQNQNQNQNRDNNRGEIEVVVTEDEMARVLDRHQPRIIMEGNATLWDNLPHDVCKLCKNLPLDLEAYCLMCNRWGVDQLAYEGLEPAELERLLNA